MNTDSKLIERLEESLACGDNDKAIEIATSVYKRELYSHLYLLSRNAYLTQELMQEAFIKALVAMKRGQYRHEKFLPWLLRIARNLFIDHVRRRKKEALVPFENEGGSAADFVPVQDLDWQTQYINAEISDDVRNLIKLLPKEQKTVIIMRMFLQMPFKEIADRTDVSMNTAIGRMRYALVNLRKLAVKGGIDLQGYRIAA